MIMFGKKNIIIFAAGGGNDIFSAIAYIRAHISNYSFEKIALVGVLEFTPFHTTKSLVDGLNVECPLIKPTSDMHRYLIFKNPKEITCNEKILPQLLSEIAPEVKNYVLMSSGEKIGNPISLVGWLRRK